MEFSTTDRIEYPIDRVFSSQRDDLPKLAEFLPSIDSIEVQSREEDKGVVQLVNIWTAAKTDIPRLIRPFIKRSMLKWVDRAVWYEDEHVCRWEIELGFLKDAILARGENRMEAVEGGQTDVTIAGDITVDAKKIPGVPKFVSKIVGSAVESFVVRMVTPNLKKTNDSVRSYLESLAED